MIDAVTDLQTYQDAANGLVDIISSDNPFMASVNAHLGSLQDDHTLSEAIENIEVHALLAELQGDPETANALRGQAYAEITTAMAEAGLTSGMGGVSAGILAGKLTGKLDEIAAAHKPNADKPTTGGKTDVDSGEGVDYDGPENSPNVNNTANAGTHAGATDGEMIGQPPSNPNTGNFSNTHNSTLTDGGINPDKFNYLFGKSTSNSHNSARSNQLALEMERLGIVDNANGRNILNQHFDNTVRQEGNVLRSYQNEHGNFEVRDSLLIGPSGKAVRLESTFEIMSDSSRRFITTIPSRSGS